MASMKWKWGHKSYALNNCFLKLNKIDIVFVSESHATERNLLQIPNYPIYFTNHQVALQLLLKICIWHIELQLYI